MRQSAPSSSCKMISIHAPRTGSDVLLLCCCGLRRGISIHAPRTGSDLLLLSMAASMRVRFQSTLPARGATSFYRAWPGLNLDFNPRSPHGERPSCVRIPMNSPRFQSTLPARGATGIQLSSIVRYLHFNPRSPHGERPRPPQRTGANPHFNPRSPHGERHRALVPRFVCRVFQSTLPARGATGTAARGGDGFRHFNPRSPHGERRHVNAFIARAGLISIHAPRTGSDSFQIKQGLRPENFNPRSPHGERRWRLLMPLELLRFQSTLPARGATGDSFQRSQPYKFQSTLPARGATVNRRHSVTAYK